MNNNYTPTVPTTNVSPSTVPAGTVPPIMTIHCPACNKCSIPFWIWMLIIILILLCIFFLWSWQKHKINM